MRYPAEYEQIQREISVECSNKGLCECGVVVVSLVLQRPVSSWTFIRVRNTSRTIV
jgi:hypothetical protein